MRQAGAGPGRMVVRMDGQGVSLYLWLRTANASYRVSSLILCQFGVPCARKRERGRGEAGGRGSAGEGRQAPGDGGIERKGLFEESTCACVEGNPAKGLVALENPISRFITVDNAKAAAFGPALLMFSTSLGEPHEREGDLKKGNCGVEGHSIKAS